MKIVEIDLTPEQYCNDELRIKAVARQLGVPCGDISFLNIVKRSLDSRRNICYHAQVEVYMQGEGYVDTTTPFRYCDCSNAPSAVIVGAGPAGLFAALRCLELGIKPVIVERGKPVERRQADIATISREGKVNPDSNWCFGEGGAGTYSDGKLFTRSTKRGNIQQVLAHFVEHGANPSIFIDAHAHIGTDRLGGIISSMRSTILRYGGEYHFNTRVVDFVCCGGKVVGVRTANGDTIEGKAVILATGHSARDIYELFYQHGWLLEAKPFAIGVRVEHPQQLVNDIQYHLRYASPEQRRQASFLPAAAYSLTTQVEGHGVFSFCMCPGGVIVPAATADGQQVVNGMSNSLRNSSFANSGIAVTVSPADLDDKYLEAGPLALLRFQQDVECRVAEAAGGACHAPVQRITDFCGSKSSQQVPRCNYMGKVSVARVDSMLPKFVTRCLQQGFNDFNRKMKGFITNEAIVAAVESRTSSPVRIPRNDMFQHPQLQGLFPCGEGAGYAGGIVSSAMDGIKCVEIMAKSFF